MEPSLDIEDSGSWLDPTGSWLVCRLLNIMGAYLIITPFTYTEFYNLERSCAHLISLIFAQIWWVIGEA